jgi:carboxylesterase type B
VAPQLPTWNTSTFSATRQPPACLQRNSTAYGGNGYSEDCLFLNVFTPQGANASNAYLPVFVWVYGGGFTSGAASIYNASLINAAGATSVS